MHTAFRFTLLTLLLGACADVSDDSLEDDAPELALVSSCPQGRCRAQRGSERVPEIEDKLAKLDPLVAERYFARATGDVGTTPDESARFRYYEGPGGRGAIHNVVAPPVGAKAGTFFIYGPILEQWARGGYERGLGYFTDPVQRGSETHQLFEVQMEYIPSLSNQGHLRTTGKIIATADGRARTTTQEEYLNSATPGMTSPSPLPCEVWNSHSVDYLPVVYSEVAFDRAHPNPCGSDPTCYPILWCSSSPPPEDTFVPNV